VVPDFWTKWHQTQPTQKTVLQNKHKADNKHTVDTEAKTLGSRHLPWMA